MLFPQRTRQTFGPVLQAELNNVDCRHVDIAVAWVRASGLLHLEAQLVGLLARGASIRVIVGLDGDNTSEEGLRALLAIANTAPNNRSQILVRHNEAGPIFHPKMYGFRTDVECRLYVGSNNLTQAGLFQNEELSLLQVAPRGSPFERQLDAFLTGLSDPADNLVRVLTSEFLDQLAGEGYVKKEAFLRGKMATRERSARKNHALFGSRSVRAPQLPARPAAAPIEAVGIEPVGLPVNEQWQILYLRLRLARGEQAQIPKPVVREMRRRIGAGLTDGLVNLRSREDGTIRQIRPAGAARGGANVNTYKFEAVPVNGETLLQIFLIGNELFFKFLGGDDILGAPVLAHLQAGFDSDPPRTFSTRPDLDSGTWYRFD